MQKFKPEFGNKDHIAFVEEEEKKQRISEIIEEFPDDFVTREEYDKLKKVLGKALSNVFKSLQEITAKINVTNGTLEGVQDYVDELISELDSIYP